MKKLKRLRKESSRYLTSISTTRQPSGQIYYSQDFYLIMLLTQYRRNLHLHTQILLVPLNHSTIYHQQVKKLTHIHPALTQLLQESWGLLSHLSHFVTLSNWRSLVMKLCSMRMKSQLIQSVRTFKRRSKKTILPSRPINNL